MKIEEVPDLKPGLQEILVQIKASGVNPVEAYIRSGQYPREPALPYTPGSDAGGLVMAVGTEVTSVKPGDRVYTSGSLSGTYAQMALCTSSQVHPLPSSVSFA